MYTIQRIDMQGQVCYYVIVMNEQQTYISFSQPPTKPAPTTLLEVPQAITYYKHGKLNIKRTLARHIKRQVIIAINSWQARCDKLEA